MTKINAKEVKGMFNNLIAKLTKPLWAKPVTDSIIEYSKSRIDKQVDVNNQPFTKLAMSTIARKGDDQALFASGRMYNSFKVTINGATLTLTNTAPYSGKHQNGIGVPKREFMGAPPDLADTILQYVVASD